MKIISLRALALLLVVLSLALILPTFSFAIGNHPESSTCSKDKPYYAVCTSSLHGLMGWTGQCFTTEKEAQTEATLHANQEHKGVKRWVGVGKVR